MLILDLTKEETELLYNLLNNTYINWPGDNVKTLIDKVAKTIDEEQTIKKQVPNDTDPELVYADEESNPGSVS